MIEDIILRHSQRGMDVLRPYMPKAFCEEAVEALLELPHGVIFLTTGFYVAGYAETDGPLGTEVLAQALKKLGYQPVIVTDALCKDYFEPMGLEVEYVPFDADTSFYQDLLLKRDPVGLISIERCGINSQNDYANMRGVSIRENTATIDQLFSLAHKKGLLQKSFDGAKRVIVGGIFWAIGYGGMYMSKWTLATVMTDVNVFADAATQLLYRMGNTQVEAEKPAIVDVGNMLILNFVPLLKTPALLAFVLFALGLILLRLRKLKRKVPLTSYGSVALGLLLLCASPFVWYLVFLNHSYLHFWFTFRELTIFAFAFAALLIVRTEEK